MQDSRVWCCLLWLITYGYCQSETWQDSSEDLMSFISRPDIRAPRWNITKHVPEQIAPGFWFVAPYAGLSVVLDRLEYAPHQVGPHIYDGDGNLIYSGAGIDNNRNAYEFRTFNVGDKSFLSYALGQVPDHKMPYSGGAFVIMDDTYNRTRTIPSLNGATLNFHEFEVFDEGRKALAIGFQKKRLNITTDDNVVVEGRFQDDCLFELDLEHKQSPFKWCPLDNGVVPAESFDTANSATSGEFDYLHANSIDKFPSGDFLLSGRHTNTVYKISREDGSIQWRLGGKFSNFTMDFNFSSQHHAKIMTTNLTTTIITILDNAADDKGRQNDTADASSAKLIALYTSETPMRAKLLQQWTRPDGELSRKRGKVLVQPNGNVFVGWSDQAYLSEFSAHGRLLLEARFTTRRFSTYRTYKSPWIGRPVEAPVLKTIRHESEEASLTVAYVSWNGATEVATWQFEGNKLGNDKSSYMGSSLRTGFETTLTVSGMWSNVRAIALDAHGNRLGESAAVDSLLGSSTHNTASPISNSSNAPTRNQNIVTMSRASLWALIFGTVSLTCSAVVLALSAVYFYRRFARRASGQAYTLVPEEQDIDLSELAKKGKRDSLLEEGSDD